MDTQPHELLVINDQLHIPLSEISYRFSRSSGPGGQHVNRSETQVELLWDVAGSPSLSPAQRERLQEALVGRIDATGVLHLTVGTRRSQTQNRQAALDRFQHLMRDALRPRRKRTHTLIPRNERQRRLERKRRRSEIKRSRGPVHDD